MPTVFRLTPLSAAVLLLSAVGRLVLPASIEETQGSGGASARTASIAGSVVAADSGHLPIPDARVTLRSVPDQAVVGIATTDSAGEFRIAGLQAGRYLLAAKKSAYLRSEYGAIHPEQPGTPLAVSDGQQISDLTLQIWKGGVLGGTITDPTGHPVSHAAVFAQRILRRNGEGRLESTANSRVFTDDRGSYRIFGLDPGDYVIAVSPIGQPTGRGRNPAVHRVTDAEVQTARLGRGVPTVDSKPEDSLSQTGYASIYYPGTLSVTDAQPVTIAADSERSALDIQCQLVPTLTVTGQIVPPSGRSVDALHISAGLTSPLDSSGLAPRRAVAVSRDGTFAAPGIVPGTYALVVRADSPATGSDAGLTEVYWAKTEFTASSWGVPAIEAYLEPAGIISGSVSFDGGAPDSSVGAVVSLQPTGPDIVDQKLLRASVGTDRRFVIRGVVPGAYKLAVSAHGIGDPRRIWILKAAVANGLNVLDSPLIVPIGVRELEMSLILTDRQSELSGQFSSQAGRPAVDYMLFVFPTDPSLRSAERRVRAGRPATDGRYQVIGLPAGDYFVVAILDADPEDLYDPLVLETLAAGKPLRITLREGDRATQDIHLVGR